MATNQKIRFTSSEITPEIGNAPINRSQKRKHPYAMSKERFPARARCSSAINASLEANLAHLLPIPQFLHSLENVPPGADAGALVHGEKTAVARVELLTVRSFRPLLLCEHRIENPENASEDEVSPEAREGHTHPLSRESNAHAEEEGHEDQRPQEPPDEPVDEPKGKTSPFVRRQTAEERNKKSTDDGAIEHVVDEPNDH